MARHTSSPATRSIWKTASGTPASTDMQAARNPTSGAASCYCGTWALTSCSQAPRLAPLHSRKCRQRNGNRTSITFCDRVSLSSLLHLLRSGIGTTQKLPTPPGYVLSENKLDLSRGGAGIGVADPLWKSGGQNCCAAQRGIS